MLHVDEEKHHRQHAYEVKDGWKSDIHHGLLRSRAETPSDYADGTRRCGPRLRCVSCVDSGAPLWTAEVCDTSRLDPTSR